MLELVAVMLISQRQRRRHVLHVEVVAEDALADELQPLDGVPVRRHQQVPDHVAVLAVVVPGEVLVVIHGVRVDEVEHRSEHVRLHVLDDDGPRPHPDLSHGSAELRLEHRRPHGEHEPVRRERLAGDGERHVGAFPALQQLRELTLEVGRRHPDAGERPGLGHLGLLPHGDHALHGEAVVLDVGALELAAADAHAVADHLVLLRVQLPRDDQRRVHRRRDARARVHEAEVAGGAHLAARAEEPEVRRDEVEAPGQLLAVAVRVEEDDPLVAGHVEDARSDEVVGAHPAVLAVPEDVEYVRALRRLRRRASRRRLRLGRHHAAVARGGGGGRRRTYDDLPVPGEGGREINQPGDDSMQSARNRWISDPPRSWFGATWI